jgi:hypothetical protein
MWQTIVGNDMSLYSVRFRLPSYCFTVGYAEKWLAINGDVGSQSQALDESSARIWTREETVEGDSLGDITAVSKRENIRWVMKAGRVMVEKANSAETPN